MRKGLSRIEMLNAIFAISRDHTSATIIRIVSKGMRFSTVKRSSAIVLAKNVATRIAKRQGSVRVVGRKGANDFVFSGAPLPGILRRLSGFCGIGLITGGASEQLATDFGSGDLSRVVRVVRGILGMEVRGGGR